MAKIRKNKRKKFNFFKEFKEFSLKGNVIDLAVGVIIGGAFQSIVNSIVKDLIMPIVGIVVGNVDYTNMFIILKDTSAAVKAGTLDAGKLGDFTYVSAQGLPVFAYGSFLTAVINFLLMALIIFLLVKGISKLQAIKIPLIHTEEESAPAPAVKVCEFCKEEINASAIKCKFCGSNVE